MDEQFNAKLTGYYNYTCKIKPGKYYELLGGHDNIPVYCTSYFDSLSVQVGKDGTTKFISIKGRQTDNNREIKQAAKYIRNWIEQSVDDIKHYICKPDIER